MPTFWQDFSYSYVYRQLLAPAIRVRHSLNFPRDRAEDRVYQPGIENNCPWEESRRLWSVVRTSGAARETVRADGP